MLYKEWKNKPGGLDEIYIEKLNQVDWMNISFHQLNGGSIRLKDGLAGHIPINLNNVCA